MPDTETLPEAERIRRLERAVEHLIETEVIYGATLNSLAPRVRQNETRHDQIHLAQLALGERVDYLEAQNRDAETDRYGELRRLIKVIALTEILSGAGTMHELLDIVGDDFWVPICAEVYRRYGHLQFDGKPLWSKPPAPPSPQTKALIAEALRRRQEA